VLARRTLPRKNKIIVLLKQGETSITVIANKVGSDSAYAGVVKGEFLRSRKA